jgi:hypothetical protein
MDENDQNEYQKINNIVNILKLNTEDFTEVLTLSNLLLQICQTNTLFLKNYNQFAQADNSITIFLSKSIICFHIIDDHRYNDFLEDIRAISSIKIDIDRTDLLAFFDSASQELPTREGNGPTYIQHSGSKQYGLTKTGDEKRLNLKSFSSLMVNTRKFELLRLMVGDEVFKYLLKYTSIFVYEEKLQNFFQITGYSLKDKLLDLLGVSKAMQNYNNSLTSSSQYNKSYTGGKENKGGDGGLKMPNPTFTVERTKIYYCPNFNRNLGFHKGSLKHPKDKTKSTLTYLYERIFSSGGKINLHILPKDKGNNLQHVEDYIKSNIAFIVDRIKTYNYSQNISRCCPNKIMDWKAKKEEIVTQIEMSDIPGLNQNLIMLIREENTVTYQEVYSFTSSFLADVLPKNFIGWDNFEVILDKLKIFIKMNRYETLNKTSLFEMKEFSFDNMDVFKHFRMKDKHYKSFGIRLKNYIMKCIIHFVFDYLVVQLIRSHFYVTEKQNDHYKTFYYHKKHWDLVIKINIKKLEAQFKPIDIKDAKTELHHKDLPFGKLRLVPKATSCRPIVSYRRKTPKTKKNLKDIFFETQKIFKHISSKMQANSDNCVVFDYKTIIKRLLYYKDMLGNDLNELSYHTLDIEACYDNIDIDKLVNFLETDEIIAENFVSNVLFLVLPKASSRGNTSLKESFEIKKLFFVTEVSEYLHFLDYLKSKNDLNFTNCMLYNDQDRYINKRDVMPNIKNILGCNIIKFNKKCFRQKKGIPQGLSISSFLCNIYFYNLEKTLSKKITRMVTEKNLLMRFMDDYLLLTNNPNTVSGFVGESFKVASQNAFNFNISKSQYNVDYTSSTKTNDKEFEWNGISFKLNDKGSFNMFSDSKDDYDLKRFSTVININIPINPSKDDYTWLIKKITSILLTGHPWIFFISRLNDENALRKNFVDICRVVLFKLIIFTRIMTKYRLLPGQKGFNDILMKCLKKFFFYINNKLTKNEDRRFFIHDLQLFIETFYKNLYNLYKADDNGELIKKSVFLFKCVRRKILSMKNNNRTTNGYALPISESSMIID